MRKSGSRGLSFRTLASTSSIGGKLAPDSVSRAHSLNAFSRLNGVAPPVPDDGRVAVTATFNEPGRYVLRVMAHDGASDTTRDISIAVESSKP